MARHATDGAPSDELLPRLADRLAQRRREEVALVIESAALDLFAVRPIGEVTVEEIALRAGVAVRTIYRYFPSKDDIFLAYPRRAADQLAELVKVRPVSETPFEAVRNSLLADVADPVELGRWMEAYTLSDTHERVARSAIEAMAAAFSAALAARHGVPKDEVWVEMAGWMAALALEVGARQLAAKGGNQLDHVLAAWDVAGTGVAHISGPTSTSRPR
jgi:AcrR family transcriptional regulator